MNKKNIIVGIVTISLLTAGLFVFLRKNNTQELTSTPIVGIIIPLTHPSLDKIVRGFCVQLNKQLNNKCSFLIRDAHGDQQVQQPAIIDEMKYKNVDLIVPIGTLCTQMTQQKTPEIPMVALAATPDTIKKSKNATGIHDEIDESLICKFLQQIIPNASKFSIIATQSEKTLPELERLRHHALNSGIAVQTIFVQTPSDIYLATHSVNTDSQAIFVLKDHLVVSSIATITQFGRDRHIPVIASDEGSVSGGAACALGVEEESIGTAGADYAALILQGTSPLSLPVQPLTKLSVFINEAECNKQGLDVTKLEAVAKQNQYNLIHKTRE